MKKPQHVALFLFSLQLLVSVQLASAKSNLLEDSFEFSNLFDQSLNASLDSFFFQNEFVFGFVRQGYHDTLAINDNKGQEDGFAYNYPSLSAAKDRAVSDCDEGCSAVLIFGNGICGAYAADQMFGNSVYGWGKASDRATAQNYGHNNCHERGRRDCIIRVWGCNDK